MLSIFVVLWAAAKPEVVTTIKPSAWCIDEDGNVLLVECLWNETNGLWRLTADNYITQSGLYFAQGFLWYYTPEGYIQLK